MAEITINQGASDADIARWIDQQVLRPLLHPDGEAKIAVPGGSTPFPVFAQLVQRDLDLSRLSVWPTDDRVVPEDHPASNTGKIRSIFEPAGAQVFALDAGPMANLPTRFDLVWLGMGADGHIASIFPNVDPLLDQHGLVQRITPDPLPPEAPYDRITLTMMALANCAQMVLVIRGEDKRRVFDAARDGCGDLPIARLMRLVHSAQGLRVTVFT